jgi:hypothetical protein
MEISEHVEECILNEIQEFAEATGEYTPDHLDWLAHWFEDGTGPSPDDDGWRLYASLTLKLAARLRAA